METSTHKYGPHLTLDLVGCNPEKLSDGKFLYKFLSALPGAIGMNKMSEPHMDLYNGIHEEWGGWSCHISIQESHMSLHAFEWGYMFLDIFSCKDFDYEAAITHIMKEVEADLHQPKFVNPDNIASKEAIEFLKDKKSSWQIFKRGTSFPPSLK